jgi:hypothetical protein
MPQSAMRASNWRVLVATVALTFVVNNSEAAQKCKLIGSSYQLVDNPNFDLVFSQQNKETAAVPVSLDDKGERFLDGNIGTSNGWPVNFLSAKIFNNFSVPVTISFFDRELKDVGEADPDNAAFYLVIPELTPALYYSVPNREPKHFPKGSVWKRKSCGN